MVHFALLPQEHLIAKVHVLCQEDERLDAALMYGSFTQDMSDAYSDLDFWLFFAPMRRGEVEPLAWCQQVAPVSYLFLNEFGALTAFFPGLVRGEFHFATSEDISSVLTWPCRSAPVERMVIIDRDKRLRPILEALPEQPIAPTADQIRGVMREVRQLACPRSSHIPAWRSFPRGRCVKPRSPTIAMDGATGGTQDGPLADSFSVCGGRTV